MIVTLIMLAVITFMATTFLVLSRRERNSVSTNTDQTTARFTADTAVERAKAQLLAGVIATGNDQNFDLMVPTNYFNPYGFNTALLNFDPTNVNYNYRSIGGPLTASDQIQNIANLLYDPRAPVYITNAKVTNDFRYYLDLNRNGLFDDTGSISNVYRDTLSGSLVTNGLVSVMGDPQWIGVLQFPDRPHSADNKFVSRWTYIVLPSGKTLDVNYLHNYSKRLDTAMAAGAGDGYTRNEGVGTWELNLAAFLTDLNTNLWQPNTAPYSYATDLTGLPSLTSANTGTAFDDALALLRYRYNSDYRTLQPANLLLGSSPAATALLLANDRIDEYADGPIMSTAALPLADFNNASLPWSGADNVNHYFTSQDFFDPAKTSTFFANRLIGAGTLPETYNRYTYYRMLAQLGTDSSPPAEDKININYRNVTNGVVTSGMETNLYAWTPLEFFTNSAARMFEKLNLHDRDGYLISITNIPIWPTTNNNYYSPAVHRVLQLAANIFEATTNTLYPCIYRPLFSARGTPATNIFISGYELVNGADNAITPPAIINQPPVDVNDSAVRAAIAIAPAQSQRNIYAAPWVIGTRKGFPNVNQIAMQSVSQMTRKLLLYRPNHKTDWVGYRGKQMFVVGVSNSVAVEVWNNSYNTVYPRPLYIRADCRIAVQIANDKGYDSGVLTYDLGVAPLGETNLVARALLNDGYQPFIGGKKSENKRSYMVPLQTNLVVLPDSVQIGVGANAMKPATYSTTQWDQLPWDNLTDPQWQLYVTNNLRCYIMDGGSGGRVVDYVQLRLEAPVRNLTQETLNQANTYGVWTQTPNTSTYWATAGAPISEGVIRQIQISEGAKVPPGPSDSEWQDASPPPASGSIKNSTDYFGAFLRNDDISSNYIQAPFTPTAKFSKTLLWEANDPFVHYLARDLAYKEGGTLVEVGVNGDTNGLLLVKLSAINTFPKVTDNLYRMNERYNPWGGKPAKQGEYPAYVTALKDPLVVSSDAWNFPTNKFPSVGWLGRVHRGTPWQSVYMKATDIMAIDPTGWQTWSGSANLFLATNIAPIVDRQLFEVFTTGINDNATRGQLSINQTNLAAWSAVLSGVIVLTNDLARATATKAAAYGSDIISPAGIYSSSAIPLPPLAQIVQGVNTTRQGFANQTFQNLGDLLATPQLTDMSPFLTNAVNDLQKIYAGGITDEVMERIPQQIMSLLTISHSPRFVVYGYGQTLHPANNSIVIGGAFNGMCTNYEVTAETAVRVLMRVDGAPTNSHVVVEQYNVLPPD